VSAFAAARSRSWEAPSLASITADQATAREMKGSLEDRLPKSGVQG
jgi:hypothetical protein